MNILTKNGLTAEIIDLDWDENPRDWDNLGTLAMSYRSKFMGDERLTSAESLAILNSNDYVAFKVNKYEHGSAHFSIASDVGGCRFDNCIVAIIYASKEKIKEHFQIKKVTKKILDKVENIFRNELTIYTNCVNNDDCFGVCIKDAQQECIDSCIGFYSHDDAVAFINEFFESGNYAMQYELAL